MLELWRSCEGGKTPDVYLCLMREVSCTMCTNANEETYLPSSWTALMDE